MLEGVRLRNNLRVPVPGLADGLYRVDMGYGCAGFVVEGGQVVECAPILWRRLAYWVTVGQRIVDY